MIDATPEERAELAPARTLRFAINLGNAATTTVAPNGDLGGPSVTLAKRFAETAGLPFELIRFSSAGEIISALSEGQSWDIAFLAVDPARAHIIHFSKPYMTIEATYAVRLESPFKSPEQLDQQGVQIASSKDAAYDLHLQRTLKHASRITFANPMASFNAFRADDLDAVAGIRQALEREFGIVSDFHILESPFLTIEHAMAVPLGRPKAARLLDRLVSRLDDSGGEIERKLG